MMLNEAIEEKRAQDEAMFNEYKEKCCCEKEQ